MKQQFVSAKTKLGDRQPPRKQNVKPRKILSRDRLKQLTPHCVGKERTRLSTCIAVNCVLAPLTQEALSRGQVTKQAVLGRVSPER